MLRPDDPDSVSYTEMIDFKRSAVRALGKRATGVLLDPEVGAAQCIADRSMPGDRGLVVALEATGYDGPASSRVSRLLDGWSVEKAKRMGASAVKILVYYNPMAANAPQQEALIANVAAEAARHDIALFLECVVYPVDAGELAGDARRAAIVESARRLTVLGGDVLKAQFPGDASPIDQSRWTEACAELDEASHLPWVLLSGGVDQRTFELQVATACRAGASGVVAGRSVWAESARMGVPERDEFLGQEAVRRLSRLADVVEARARPWHEKSSLDLPRDLPGEGWYRNY
jgi:tagatose 1,6-diphosphate aldolase